MAPTSDLPNRNISIPWVLAGLALALGLAGAIAYAVTNTGKTNAEVTESVRQEIIDASSILRQEGYTQAQAVTYVVGQIPDITSSEVSPLVAQAYGPGRDVIALSSELMTYFVAGMSNNAAWLRMAQNYCTPLLLRASSSTMHSTCITNNNVVSGVRQCQSSNTNVQVGWMQRLGYTPTSAERAFYMESTSPVSGLVTKARADETSHRATVGWTDCPWTVGWPDDPYMPALTNNAPSYLLLVATVTGAISNAPGGLMFSAAPAGLLGACTVNTGAGTYSCTVTRGALDSKSQTLTLTAAGVDADGNAATTDLVVNLVYP